MKSLVTFVNENMLNEYFEGINAEIVCEALKDPKLQTLAKQLRDCGSKNKNGWNNKSFSGIFGRFNVAWDEITEADWIEFNCEDAKEAANAKRTVRKCITGRANTIFGISLVSKDGENIDYLITYNGSVIDFNAKGYAYNYETGKSELKHAPKEEHNLRQYETLSFLENAKKVWVLDLKALGEKNDNLVQKQRNRRDSQSGMVLQGDEQYYKKVAQDNVERYKKMIAKAKAEKAAKEDTIAKDVQEIVNKVMQLSVDVAANPVKYADVSYRVCSIIESVYSTKRYDSKHGPSGSNGLLTLFKSYLDNHMDMAKNGGYGFQRDSQAGYKKDIVDKIEQIKKQIADIEEKIK